jgi:plasmid stability protein
MANIQVKNVPEELHRRLRRSARRRRTTMRELILDAVQRELSSEEFVTRLRRRRAVDLGRPAAEFLREARRERE